MARRKGSLDLDGAVELAYAGPLDARQLVRTKEELLSEGSFDFGFNGLLVAERTEGKLYMLMDKDNPTVEASWKDITGGGGAGGPVDWSDVQNKPTFATVATSGSYNDLSEKPTIPEAYDDTALAARVTAVENGKANTADLAPVATSGSYTDLGDKPTIPETYDDTEVRNLIAGKANSADLAPVATSGSYNDLGDKPTIPEAYDDTALAARVTAVETNKANSADLAAVATSGSYNDLSDKPTIPAEVTVDDAMSDASENPVQNKVVLAAIGDAIDVVETAIADRYTKAETDAKIAEAMVDVDNEHFHPVTALPAVADAKENHEYVLITYAQDGTTIESETHYLFYDGVFHEKQTQVSLDGYATEAYVGQQLATLATVATSGSYDDLSDKPTIPEAYDDTALAARVTANETAIADRYTKSETDALLDDKASLQVAAIPGGGGGEEINAIVSQGENSVSVSYYKDGTLPNTLNLNVDSDYFSIPATGYVDQKAAETQNNAQIYTDLKLTQKQNTLVSGTNIKTFNGESLLGSGDIPIPTYVGSGWGVAKIGSVEGNTSMTSITVDISDLGLSSIDDYQVAVSVNGMESYVNHNAIVAKTSKNAFTILTGPAEPGTFIVNYTVVAKGYGGVPNGGTTGQVLAKKSNADGDTEWVPGGGGINIEVGKERWQGTYTDENGETFQVYSKMVYIPALPATAGVTTYDHGVANIKQILNIYGFTTDGFVLNAPRQVAADNITIYQASKNASNQTFSIEVGKDRSNKKAYVVMVYAKNN